MPRRIPRGELSPIGQAIDDWLVNNDRSFRYLAICLGISLPFLSMIRSGDKPMPIDRIKRLPMSLRIRIVDIMCAELMYRAERLRKLCVSTERQHGNLHQEKYPQREDA